MQRKNKTLTNIIIVLLVVFTALVGISEYFINFALSNDTTQFNIKKELNKHKRKYPWQAHWTDSIRNTGALRDSFIIDSEGNTLHAWYLPAPKPTGNTAVIVHGYKSNSLEMLHIGYMFNHELNWNILLPDLESHGLSQGNNGIQMGWDDRTDVNQWIRVAKGIFNSDTIVVHGISMGAATTMCVAGEDLGREYVRAFIEDCGYTSVWDEFKGELQKQFSLPAFPILHATSIINKLQNGWSFKEASPLTQVSKCRKPMLFIHGDADTYVPTNMVYSLYKAKPQPKELWIAKGSIHAEAYKDHYKEYTEQVRAFLNKHSLNASAVIKQHTQQ